MERAVGMIKFAEHTPCTERETDEHGREQRRFLSRCYQLVCMRTPLAVTDPPCRCKLYLVNGSNRMR